VPAEAQLLAVFRLLSNMVFGTNFDDVGDGLEELEELRC
jgi:hypothetical protein